MDSAMPYLSDRGSGQANVNHPRITALTLASNDFREHDQDSFNPLERVFELANFCKDGHGI
jgi:hypothetical protein